MLVVNINEVMAFNRSARIHVVEPKICDKGLVVLNVDAVVFIMCLLDVFSSLLTAT